MKILNLTSVILLALSVPVVMEYRILPIVGTPYWLFGVLFLLLAISVLDSKLLKVLLWPILIIVLGGTTVTAIVDRSKTAPVFGVHDIVLQQEAAMRYVLEGKNPYKETYFSTPVEEFNYDELGNTSAINPALYHFVMPPWYLLFPFAIYFISTPAVGYFDGRMVLLVALVGLLIILWKWFKNKNLAMLAIILTSLSPSSFNYFIEGRSDVFALFWFVWALYLLEKKQKFFSALIFGLALMSKQTIWVALPFYLLVARGYLAISLFVSAILLTPFLLWDAEAFISSTIGFLSGGALQSYPVSGYGFGMILHEFGIIKNLHAYYPFIIWQIVFTAPVLIWSLRRLVVKSSMGKLLIGYAATLAVFWYFSRYFNNSHLGYISSVFAIGILKAQDEEGL